MYMEPMINESCSSLCNINDRKVWKFVFDTIRKDGKRRRKNECETSYTIVAWSKRKKKDEESAAVATTVHKWFDRIAYKK